MANKLFHFNDAFDLSLFQNVLKTKWLGRSVVYRPVVDSTMIVAQREVNEKANGGTVVIAEQQTSGIGRNNRSWISSPNGNIYATLILYPKKLSELPKLNLCTAISIAKAVNTFGVNSKIKWPNDIWIGNKKMSGILVDSSIMGSEISVLIGMGINVNEDYSSNPEINEIATSISMNTQSIVRREEVLAKVLNNLEEILELDSKDIIDEFSKYDMLSGNNIIVMPKKKEDESSYYNAKAIGLDENGYLMIELENGERNVLYHEEVSIRPSNN